MDPLKSKTGRDKRYDFHIAFRFLSGALGGKGGGGGGGGGGGQPTLCPYHRRLM